MRNVIVSEFLTLDGVMEAPEEWSLDFFNDEIGEYKEDELFAADALLLGRNTYQTFAEAWPERTDETGFADRMNSLPKYVVSTSLEEAEWNNSTIISENPIDEVSGLKQQSGQDILVNGSATLVNTLMQHDLIDEYRLMVFPIVLGSGKRLFRDGSDPTALQLAETETLGSDVVVLTYQPAKED